jgi:hypothetical protein
MLIIYSPKTFYIISANPSFVAQINLTFLKMFKHTLVFKKIGVMATSAATSVATIVQKSYSK